MPIEVWLGHCSILCKISSHFFRGGCEGIALLGSMHLIALPSRVELIVIFYISQMGQTYEHPIIDQPIYVSHRAVTAKIIMSAHSNPTSTVLQHCTSTQWETIGRVLASRPQLLFITLMHCNVGDAFCRELSSSKSLQRLRMGSCS